METKTEIWKDIEGFEGIYQVSNFGRVRSVTRYVPCRNGFPRIEESRIMKQQLNAAGYWEVSLRIDNKKNTRWKVHRLVGKAFVPDYFEGAQINHKDENPKNNNADNLEWCTPKYNSNYKNRTKNWVNSYNAKNRQIVQMSLDGEVLQIYPSLMEASRATGINSGQICAVCQHRPRYHTAGGFKWKYKET